MPIGYSQGSLVENEADEAIYYSSENPLTAPSGSYEEYDLGIKAAVVNVRSQSGVRVSFVDPSSNTNSVIRLIPDELPFTIGGSRPINATSIFLRSDGSSDAQVNVIAYR